MRKYFIIAGIKYFIIIGMLFIFSWIILSAYDALKYKRQPLDKQRFFTVLEEIDRSIEKNEGKLDLNKITARDDWEKFCLVMAYSTPEEELASFVNDVSSIEKVFPDTYDDSFGVGILFVKDKKIIDHMHMTATNIPASSKIGKNIKAIVRVAPNGTLRIVRLDPTSTHLSDRPQPTCYGNEYTIKIDQDWEYSIVKKGKIR